MTVVVGVDNSPASRAALELAAQEARWRQAPLVAVSAFEPPLGAAVAGYPAAAMHTEGEQKATAESELRAAVDDTLGGQGIQADLRVSAGLAGRVIIETARETNAQLVVLAAHPASSVLPARSASTSCSKPGAQSRSSRPRTTKTSRTVAGDLARPRDPARAYPRLDAVPNQRTLAHTSCLHWCLTGPRW